VAHSTWEQSKLRKLRGYIRRRPEETVLYRAVYHHRDELERQWDELFYERYGSLRREVLDALDRYLSCGILAHGCARAHCDKCGGTMKIVAFIQQEREINKLLENLGYPQYRAPPPLHKTRAGSDRTVEPVWDDYDQSSSN